mgnify:CR=1 FL=1
MLHLNENEETLKRNFIRFLKTESMLYRFKYNFFNGHIKYYKCFINSSPEFNTCSFNNLIRLSLKNKLSIISNSFEWYLTEEGITVWRNLKEKEWNLLWKNR